MFNEENMPQIVHKNFNHMMKSRILEKIYLLPLEHYTLEECLEPTQTREPFARRQRFVASLFLVCVGLHRGLRQP